MADAVASYPTITYANSVSFVTGVLPAHHGIMGNKWFDREEMFLEDYTHMDSYRRVDGDFNTPTIYEMLSDQPTATITVPVRRGATRAVDNWASVGIAWFFGLTKTVDDLSVKRLESAGQGGQSDRPVAAGDPDLLPRKRPPGPRPRRGLSGVPRHPG